MSPVCTFIYYYIFKGCYFIFGYAQVEVKLVELKNVVSEFIRIGRQVDPLMEHYLLSNLSEAFKEPVLHQIRTGGKRVRPALTIISAKALGGRQDEAMPAAAAVELTHQYSLVLDDIIDHSELRRGQPTVWKKYGISTAILVAVHYRESISEALLDTVDPPTFTRILVETTKVLTEGERLDILFEQAGRADEPYVVKNRYKIVTFDDYMDMISKKTAALIETACVFGALSARADKKQIEALKKYGHALGIAFQIGDDIIDLFGEEEKTGKRVGQDIVEHKLGNIVIALALEELEGKDKEKLLATLRKDEVTFEEAREVINLIKAKTRAKERAQNLRDEWVSKALQSLRALPENEHKKMLEGLARFIAVREY